MPSAARARVSPLSPFGSRRTSRIWLSRESSRTTLAVGSIGYAVRGGPPAGRSASVMSCPFRSPERLGLASDELRIPRPVAVALGHARAWIAAAFALRPVARKRDEGSVEVHELTRVDRAATDAPWGVRRQRGQELQASDAAQLVAVGIDLGDANGERTAEPRRLQRDDAVRPSRPVVDAVRLVRDLRPSDSRNRRSSHAIHRDERAGIETRVRTRGRLAPVAHPLDQPR